MSSNKINIFSHTADSYAEEVFLRLGKGKVHAILIYHEWFKTGEVKGEDPAFNNAKKLLEEILEFTSFELSLNLVEPPKIQANNTDIAQKFLLKTHDDYDTESVHIPTRHGYTLCISSQLGCRMGCTFCETGRMGLIRNLTSEEIINQVFYARFVLKYKFRSIVFMGMGEPFDNYDHVIQAIKVLTNAKGFGFEGKQITVSTSGHADKILKFAQDAKYVNLAVSINAPTNSIREKIMPVNKRFPLEVLYDSMKQYCQMTKRQIFAEYVLLRGINDQLEHAQLLADYLKGLDVKINLIPYNNQSSPRFLPPNKEEAKEFALHLTSNGYTVLWRQLQGDQLMAACGQLGNVLWRRQRHVSSMGVKS
ncbi:MAG: rlmn1 [Chlamydiales bacterium]|jgi:23S rRNA (adenine2503-C2)-methyltransferase|nr:rlmn1 [Chlamydiales bacterium]